MTKLFCSEKTNRDVPSYGRFVNSLRKTLKNGKEWSRIATVMKMEITILYEDKDLVVCVKEPGILSEESGMPMLLQAQCGGSFFCVHRLDRAVGGVMVYARNEGMAAALSRMTAERKLEKDYLALVPDVLTADEGVMEDLLFRDRQKNKSYVVKRMRKGVKSASLSYRVLQRHNGVALVKLRLHTGRSHQIRCQLSSRGAPILGDGRYGSTIKRETPALWSYALAFTHPQTGKRLCYASAPKGEDWQCFREMFTQTPS